MSFIDTRFEILFNYARQITPYLDGKICLQQDHIQESGTSSESLHSLYRQIQQANPEAGQAYWVTRTWDLLCWQPVFVSFIAIYAQKSLPDVARIAQYQKPMFITGFSFEPHHWQQSRRDVLINKAGEQLNKLFDGYRQSMNEWTRIRPGFTQHLLADLLLSCLVRLQEIRPRYNNAFIQQQAVLWLDAFNLSHKHLTGLHIDPQTNRLALTRISCCLVYKCHARPLCANCPRMETNKLHFQRQLAVERA